MNRICLPHSLKDEEMVSIEGLASQLNSISRFATPEEAHRRHSLKTASFNPPEPRPLKLEDKRPLAY
jgi:hypothetical protein